LDIYGNQRQTDKALHAKLTNRRGDNSRIGAGKSVNDLKTVKKKYTLETVEAAENKEVF
jgi:hypothetical protein